MAYIFMLGAMPLPIPPKSLDITSPSKNETVTLINDQEINIPKLEGLREISFDFLLPTFQKYPFETYRIGDYTAATFILYLKAWKASGIPLPFIVVRMSPSGKFLYFTSIMCVIEDYTYAEDAEEYGFDTNCSIKLKEYVFYSTKKVKYKDGQATTKKSRSTAERVKKSEVKPRKGESATSALKREGHNLNLDYTGDTNFDFEVADIPVESGNTNFDWLSEYNIGGEAQTTGGDVIMMDGEPATNGMLITDVGEPIQVVPTRESIVKEAFGLPNSPVLTPAGDTPFPDNGVQKWSNGVWR